MRFFLIAILLCLCSVSGYTQKMASDYFDEGLASAEDKDYANALASFHFVMVHYPKSELYPMAVFNVGFVYYAQAAYDSAGIIFKKIIKSNFNEKDRLKGGIMDDPYANYKHRASELLSDIYFKRKQYDSALYYFSMADTVFPYLHFCGNEMAWNSVNNALKYSEIYRKMGNDKKALASLLPVVFQRLTSIADVLDTLQVLLKGQQHLKQDLNSALKNIYSKAKGKGKYTYNDYYIKFLDAEIPVSYEVAFVGESESAQKIDTAKTVENIKDTDFYKMIAEIH